MDKVYTQIKVRFGLEFGLKMLPISHSFYTTERMAGTTGLEPATSAVTGQRSNQLNYVPRESTPDDEVIGDSCIARKRRRP